MPINDDRISHAQPLPSSIKLPSGSFQLVTTLMNKLKREDRVHLYRFRAKAEPSQSWDQIMKPIVIRRGERKAEIVPHSTDIGVSRVEGRRFSVYFFEGKRRERSLTSGVAVAVVGSVDLYGDEGGRGDTRRGLLVYR